MQVSWRIIRISHARTRARTIVANGASLYLSLFFSVRSVRTSTAYIYTCVFGSAGRDGWARRSLRTGRRAWAPEGSPTRDWCVMGGDRSATHASAMTVSPRHRISSSWRSFLNSTILRRYSQYLSWVDRILTSYVFIRDSPKYIFRTIILFSPIHRRIPTIWINKFTKWINK